LQRVKYSLPDYLLAMDVILDSLSQKLRKKDPILARQLRRALGLTRQQMHKIPQVNYTIKRCMNRDELPWNGPRSIARRNRRSYWRRRRHEREIINSQNGFKGGLKSYATSTRKNPSLSHSLRSPRPCII